MTNYYACVTLDVIRSQSHNLNDVESILGQLKDCLNNQFSNELTIAFDIRKGDELIGVLSRFGHSYKVLRAIDEFCEENGYNIAFYIGCGFGTIDTDNKSSIHVANGSAIINAIYARDDIVKKGKREAKLWEITNQHKVYFYTEDFPYAPINALHYYINELIHKRSQKQKEIVRAVKEHPDDTYESIGKMFGYKSPKTSVSNHLYAANHELVAESEKSLVNLLDFHQNQLEQN
ncbi:hypothetical protein ACTWQB_04855 [Piscibacillus sp. B03]|uniref:hypothetical protein n=1 Tax=Piscibacillus sp. B03 TaxID=3457430 RepID=UPI003FCEB40C